MDAPRRAGASATRYPCSERNVAPIRSSPRTCRLTGRAPMSSPPGRATRARPHRASNGPRTTIEARTCRASSCGASNPVTEVASSSATPCSSRTATPTCSSISAITAQSRIRGTFPTTLRPGARIEAAINFSAEFFAPETWTVPSRRAPPVTRKRSIGRWYPGTGAGRSAGELDPRVRLRDLGLGDLVLVLDGTALQIRQPCASRLDVDLRLELRIRGQHVGAGHALVRRHMQEPAVDDRAGLAPVGQHPQRPDRELHQQRRVAAQDADLTVDAARDQLLHVAGPHLADGRDDVDLDRHRRDAALGRRSAIRLPLPSAWPARPLPRSRRRGRTPAPEGGRTPLRRAP